METPNLTVRRFTWTHALLLTLAVELVGAGLGWQQPIWFAPPRFHYTPLVYLGLELLWAPLLLILSQRNLAPAKYLWIIYLMVLVIVGVAGIMLLVTGFQVISFVPNAPDEAKICQAESLPDNAVRYTCRQGMLLSVYRYTLEGAVGSPFARLVNVELVASL